MIGCTVQSSQKFQRQNKVAEDDSDLSDEDDTSTELEYHASDSEDEELDESTSDDDYEPGRQQSNAGPKKVVRFLREQSSICTHTL